MENKILDIESLEQNVSYDSEQIDDTISNKFSDCNNSTEIPASEKLYFVQHELTKKRHIYRILARIRDVLFSLIALVILAPFMVIVAIVIVIDSPGASPFFVQKRVGINGKEFKFYKFRSMIPNADSQLDSLLTQNEMNGPVFKIKHDPRITRVGRFIRKTGIDELPQFYNILIGNMSLVGPRPALIREVEQYDEYAKQRLYVTPGLTCYWQIQPHRNSLSFEEWMDLDMKYIHDQSLWVDWKIIFGTIGTVLKMYGE